MSGLWCHFKLRTLCVNTSFICLWCSFTALRSAVLIKLHDKGWNVELRHKPPIIYKNLYRVVSVTLLSFSILCTVGYDFPRPSFFPSHSQLYFELSTCICDFFFILQFGLPDNELHIKADICFLDINCDFWGFLPSDERTTCIILKANANFAVTLRAKRKRENGEWGVD